MTSMVHRADCFLRTSERLIICTRGRACELRPLAMINLTRDQCELPSEIWEDILSHLSGRDPISVAQCNKAFRQRAEVSKTVLETVSDADCWDSVGSASRCCPYE